MPSDTEVRLTLTELQKKLPEVTAYTFEAGKPLLILYDMNAVSRRTISDAFNEMFNRFGIVGLLIGYDGAATDNPLSIFEVKK